MTAVTAKRGLAPLALPQFSLDLSRLRDLAFGRQAAPDHPLRDEAEVQKMLAGLSPEAADGLAELTHWTGSINQTDAFAPDARARVLLAMDPAAHDYWRALCREFLAPNGRPAEERDADAGVFRVLLEVASEFAHGYALCVQDDAADSPWLEKNLAHVLLRRSLWLGRRLMLANALRQPNAASIWEEMHALYCLADEREVLRTAVRVSADGALTTCIRQEYIRALLIEIAGHDTMRGREIELAFRIAGRVAASALLEAEPIAGAVYGVVPQGAQRPVPVRRLNKTGALYLDTSNCLARLQALLARDTAPNPADADTLFQREFTVRETTAMVRRLLEHWSPNPPKRRSQRVALDAPALLRHGFDAAAQIVAALDQGVSLKEGMANSNSVSNSCAKLRIQFDEKKKGEPAPVAKTVHETRARLVDASAAGLGMLIPRKDAAWVKVGALLAIYVEPGPDWIVGTLRRISAQGDMLRVGIRILARRPRLGWFQRDVALQTVWDNDHDVREKNFLEHYQRGVLLDAELVAGAKGEMLLPHGIAKAGTRLDFPFDGDVRQVRVTEISEANREFDRAAFEVLAVVPANSTPPAEKKKVELEIAPPDAWGSAS
jgi:hypothetical protein